MDGTAGRGTRRFAGSAGGDALGKVGNGRPDLTTIEISPTSRLGNIPLAAHDYQVAGHSPLQWAVAQSKSGDVAGEDFNADPRWADRPENLIDYLRRLTYVGTRTAQIVAGLLRKPKYSIIVAR